jgi:Phospholipase_D-nuclease N-terminal
MTTLLADIVIPTTNLIGLVILILDIVAIVSVVAGHGSLSHKLLWTLLILVLPVLGMILYFLIGRSSADVRI